MTELYYFDFVLPLFIYSIMKQGFTFLEVMIASAILAISLTMLIGVMVTFKHSAFISSHRLEALHEARDHIETLLTNSYNDLNIGTFTLVFSTGNLNGFYTVSSNATFTGVKDISLTVNWVNPSATVTSSVTMNSSMSSALHE